MSDSQVIDRPNNTSSQQDLRTPELHNEKIIDIKVVKEMGYLLTTNRLK